MVSIYSLQVRPRKDQPFYHLLAEAPSQPSYVAYVSQQNLLPDETDDPVSHPLVEEMFTGIKKENIFLRQNITKFNLMRSSLKQVFELGPLVVFFYFFIKTGKIEEAILPLMIAAGVAIVGSYIDRPQSFSNAIV